MVIGVLLLTGCTNPGKSKASSFSLREKNFPIETIKKNSFNRNLHDYSLADFKKNGQVDYKFFKDWLEDAGFYIDFCDEDITGEDQKEMERTPCEYPAYFLDYFDSEDLFFFTIAHTQILLDGTGFYHFVFDKNKKKILHIDWLASIGGYDDISWDADIIAYDGVFYVKETLNDGSFDSGVDVRIKVKKFIFSADPTIEEVCDSVNYRLKNCFDHDSLPLVWK